MGAAHAQWVVAPSAASLAPGQSQQYTVSGTNGPIAATWTISPADKGSITPTGLYTAPYSVSSFDIVNIIATVPGGSAVTIAFLQPGTAAPPPPVVSISVAPQSVTLSGGQSQQFTASVTGSTNTGVQWSITPAVGTIAGGKYTAPASITSNQTVTLTATSAADSSKSASSVISLVPTVGITLSPSAISLSGGQSKQFAASVTGTTNTGVTWSLSPALGTVVNGLYTAPATISSAQTVVLTAASSADPTKTATSTISLVPPAAPVTIAVTPTAVSLAAGQSAQFSISISGTSNTGVSWSLSPTVGTISNGLYMAPGTITALQTVILTAVSLADPTKTAQSTITLTPATPTSVTVSPGQVSLTQSQTQQFTATVQGASGSGVQWSINPGVGIITTGGLYTAPASISSQQTVTVTATSTLDATKKGSATVALQPPAPTTQVQLPVEVIGLDGKTAAVSFAIPAGVDLTGAKLWMQIHGLSYQTEASLQWNNGGWWPINDTTVNLLGLASSYGGIGGGFRTLTMTMGIPSGALTSGTNVLTFRFNGTNGITSGYRVLGFNIVASNGTQLLPSSTFVWDDPNTWQPPSSAASDITAGKNLWYQGALSTPTASGQVSIQAKCTGCHAQDGRDLKYFNYSNNSIRTRAMFHGLTAQQGDQIASYIRTLNVPNPGRPWNPPYQPGPGMDSKPISEWAAGAGLNAVLDHDADMLPYLMPGGSTANWGFNAYLNARETPIALQLPDWNQWLPTIHPLDAWGAAFTNSTLNTNYLTIRSQLAPNNATSYQNAAWNIRFWLNNFGSFEPIMWASPNWSDPTYVQKVYSVNQWNMTKLWEINQEFGLESMPRAVFGPQAADRAWYTNMAFAASPAISKIPRPSPGIENGTVDAHVYLSFAWYHMQLILNDGNGTASGTWPIDWAYALGYPINDLTWDTLHQQPRPTAGLLLEWLAKALQSGNLGEGAEDSDPNALVTWPAQKRAWSGVSTAQKVQLINAWLTTWLNHYTQLTSAQLFALRSVSPTLDFTARSLGTDLAQALPLLRYEGADMNLLNQLTSWAAGYWPTYNWAGALNAPCAVWDPNTGEVKCTIP